MDRIIHYHNRIIFQVWKVFAFIKCTNVLTFEGENERKYNDMFCRLHYQK